MILHQEVKSAAKLEVENYKKEIVAHTYTAVTCSAASYAYATMGDTTKEVARVKQHKVIIGEVQYEARVRGEGDIVEEDASTAILRGGHAPSQPYTPVWGKDEFLKKGGGATGARTRSRSTTEGATPCAPRGT